MAFYTPEERKRYWRMYPLIEKIKFIGPIKTGKMVMNAAMRNVDNRQKHTKLLSSATSIQLEPTTKCNLRCKFCISPLWDRRGKDMSFTDFKKTVDSFPCLTEIHMQGIGEPLMCKDFEKMLEYCKKKRILLSTTTNATLINEEKAEMLVSSGMDLIVASFDGAKKETFESIRIGAKYDKVIENIRTLIRVRGERKRPAIIFNFTGCMENLHELPDVLRLAKEIGIDGVEVWGVHFWTDNRFQEKHPGISLAENAEYSRKILKESLALAKELGIPLKLAGDINKTEDPGKRAMCQRPFRSCFITFDGYVTICADIADPRKANVGNIFETDFGKIWNGSKYVANREECLKGILSEQCKVCGGHNTIR